MLGLLAACGGGGGSSPTPSVVVLPPDPAAPVIIDWSGVEALGEASAADDLVIMIGDETGPLFTYEKGGLASDDQILIASASKMVFGLLIWTLVEDGPLSQTSRPQDTISFWTDMAGDGRSDITLDQLMGFVSGFNEPPENPGCIGDGGTALADCVEQIYDGGLDTLPGAAYYYGPEHMQIAGLMAQEASGQEIGALLDDRLVAPFGLSDATFYSVLAGDNPRFSGNMRSSADDYALLLTAVLNGDLVADRDAYLADRTSNVTFGYRPGDFNGAGADWHYGFGFWKECDDLSYTAACDTDPTISSPGAFGFTPWIDFETGYWGIVAIEAVAIDGMGATQVSVLLEQEIQTIVEAELN